VTTPGLAAVPCRICGTPRCLVWPEHEGALASPPTLSPEPPSPREMARAAWCAFRDKDKGDPMTARALFEEGAVAGIRAERSRSASEMAAIRADVDAAVDMAKTLRALSEQMGAEGERLRATLRAHGIDEGSG